LSSKVALALLDLPVKDLEVKSQGIRGGDDQRMLLTRLKLNTVVQDRAPAESELPVEKYAACDNDGAWKYLIRILLQLSTVPGVLRIPHSDSRVRQLFLIIELSQLPG
jgi:hypothetical protein